MSSLKIVIKRLGNGYESRELNSSYELKKLNNSYESEPSSGRGSSLSDTQFGAQSDDENANLAPSYQHEVEKLPTNHVDDLPNDNVLLRNPGFLSGSSQESAFEGFTESSSNTDSQNMFQHDNAIQRTTDNMLYHNEEVNNEARNLCLNESSMELSFAGRINKLSSDTVHSEHKEHLLQTETITAQHLPTENHGNLSEKTVDTTELLERSFFLTKYTNEKSPDLFGDDDDDDNDDNGDVDDDNHTNDDVKNSDCSHLDQQQSERAIITDIIPEAEEGKDDLEHNGNGTGLQSDNKVTATNLVDEQTTESSAQCTSLDERRDLLLANYKRERELLRRIRKSLAGVPPPPTVTMPKMDLMAAVLEHKEDILNFFKKDASVENVDNFSTDSLFKPTHSLEDTQAMAWKDILSVRQHGLSFNLCKASEKREYLSLSIIDRFIGAETASSHQQTSPSSVKKRNMRLKMLTASPGSRLSHLARRRTVFSSANLAINSKKLSSSLGPQILLNKKKIKNRRKGTPKRKTPGSKRKNERKTPSTSMRKRLQNRCDLMKFGPSRETSKRALFQSPNKGNPLQTHKDSLKETRSVIKPDVAKRIEKSKRALFSSEPFSIQALPNTNYTDVDDEPNSYAISFDQKNSTQKLENLFKRKRVPAENSHDDDDDVDLLAGKNSKIFCGNSKILTPRALKIKSQSFCIGAGSSSQIRNHCDDIIPYIQPTAGAFPATKALSGFSNSIANISSMGNATNYKLPRAQSENVTMASNSLTENQRKKLLWAVSQALKEKKVTAEHKSFKEYAAVLARVVRRIFQEYYQKCSTSNSETMLRLAKKYAFNVITGKNADDIYFHAKAQIDEKKTRSESRLTGYITSEDYENRKITLQQKTLLSQTFSQKSCGTGSMQNLFTTESSLDSIGFGVSQPSSVSVSTSTCTLPSQGTQAKPDLENQLQEPIDNLRNFEMIKNPAQQLFPQQEQQAIKYLPIQPNVNLQNSSSKNNICSLALRENVDSEQQRSAQKDFTGKDQRNMSPYATLPSHRLGSAIKAHSSVVQDLFGTNVTKAKRQISFDS